MFDPVQFSPESPDGLCYDRAFMRVIAPQMVPRRGGKLHHGIPGVEKMAMNIDDLLWGHDILLSEVQERVFKGYIYDIKMLEVVNRNIV